MGYIKSEYKKSGVRATDVLGTAVSGHRANGVKHYGTKKDCVICNQQGPAAHGKNLPKSTYEKRKYED